MSATLTLGNVQTALAPEAAACFVYDLAGLLPHAAKCAQVFTRGHQLTVSDYALPFVRRQLHAAGAGPGYPILTTMQGSSVLFSPGLQGLNEPIILDSDEYGRWEVFALERLVDEARRAFPYIGLERPAEGRLLAGVRADTTLDDAQLLLSAIVLWEPLARSNGGCLWMVA